MALALVNHQGGTAAAGTTAVYTVTSTGTAAGTGLILAVAWRLALSGSQTITSITDDKSNTWVKAAADNNVSVTGKGDIWHVNPSTYISGVTTITVHFSAGASSAWFFYEVSGGASSWLDQAPTPGDASTASPTVTTGTLAQANEFAVGAICYQSATNTVSGITSGWTADTVEQVNSPNNSLQAAHQTTSATTALTYAGTISASNQWSDLIATFKEAPAVTAMPQPIRVMSQAVTTAAVR